MTTPIEAPSLDAIRAARGRIAGAALRTPLVRLDTVSSAEIFLKLECLQPIGSFKVRAAANAMGLAAPEALARGVWTASAGNMAQGLAWEARRRGIACTVVVPEAAPETKLAAIGRLGARVVKVPFEQWWQILVERTFPGMEGLFVHPTADTNVAAGNGTIGLEILEDLPDVDAVLAPWGGGGLSCGIASALRGSGSPARVFACEVETAAPLAASIAAGRPTTATYTPSFVDGIGGRSVFPEMWNLASTLIAGSLVVSVAEIADAVRHLATRARVVAEGAGAAPVAAALSLSGGHTAPPGTPGGAGAAPVAAALSLERGAHSAPRTPGGAGAGPVATALSNRAPQGKLVCVVSGGNIDAAVLSRILGGAAG